MGLTEIAGVVSVLFVSLGAAVWLLIRHARRRYEQKLWAAHRRVREYAEQQGVWN